MPKLSFGLPFKGEIPLQDDRILSDKNAKRAQNVNLQGGGIRPYGLQSLIQALNPGGAVKSVYQYEDSYWLNWTSLVDARPGFLAADALKRLYWAGDGYPKKGDFDAITNSSTTGALPFSSYTMGVKTPTAAPTEGTSVPGISTTLIDVAYVYTFVSEWGEESGPSPSLVIQDVPIDTFADTGTEYIQLTGLQTDPGAPYNITGGVKRLYRGTTAADGSVEYLFVDEIPLATTSYNDDTSAGLLGEAIPSYRIEAGKTITWDEPPADLVGMADHPGQFLVGYTGNSLYFSEPPNGPAGPQPHAWPSAYELKLNYEIIAIGVADSSIFVATTGYPYVVTGEHPLAMSVNRVPVRQACVSRASFKEITGGVMYSSPDGLFVIRPGEVKLYTQELFRRDQWQDYDAESIIGTIHDGRYFGFYQKLNGDQGSFIIDPINPDAAVTQLTPFATAVFSSLEDDHLYLVSNGGLYQWDGDTVNQLVYDYLSAYQYTPKPINYGAAQVIGNFPTGVDEADIAALEALAATIEADNLDIFDDITGLGSLNGHAFNEVDINGDGWQITVVVPANSLTFKYWVDDNLKLEQLIINQEPFRLPNGFLGRRHQVELLGDIPIQFVQLAVMRGELE